MKRLLLALTLFATGCQTIYFEQGGGSVDRATSKASWHHGGGIYGLIEFSDPYDPKAQCAPLGLASRQGRSPVPARSDRSARALRHLYAVGGGRGLPEVIGRPDP